MLACLSLFWISSSVEFKDICVEKAMLKSVCRKPGETWGNRHAIQSAKLCSDERR